MRCIITTCALLVFLATALPAAAQQWNIVGSRFQGMGGAGVATVNDSTSTYWNPAALGFKKKGEWDVNLPVTVNAAIENRLLRDVSNLVVRFDELSGTFDSLSSGVDTLPPIAQLDQTATDTVTWLDDLAQLGGGRQSVHTEIGIGLMGHVNHFGFSVLSNTQATIFPSVDLSNLGFDTTTFDALLAGVTLNPGDPGGIKGQVEALGTFWNATNSDQYISAFLNAGLDPLDPTTNDLIFDIANSVNDPANSYANNESGVLTAGISTQEFGISYGHTVPIPFFKPLDNKISVGATLKYMMGITFVNTSTYQSGISNGGAGGFLDLSDTNISHNVGLDFALDARPYDWVRIGMIFRNVNGPKFDAGPLPDIELPAQVRMGTAIMPIDNFVLALDFDITENTLSTIPGFKSRVVALGSEYTIPMGKHVAMALRLGGYTDTTSETSDDWAITGGLGLKTWGFVLDLSAGSSLANESVQTGTNSFTNIPTLLNIGLGLKWEKSI